jgi:transposase
MGFSRYSQEYRENAVRLLRESGKPVNEVARTAGVTPKTLREWAKQVDVDAGKGPSGALTSVEKAELAKLRCENRELRRERDFLQQAAAYFAKTNR